MEGLSQRCPLPPAAQGCPRPGRGTALLVLTLLVLMYPLLRGLALHLHSAVTGSYIPGTHSIAFVTCLNEQIAKDIAREGRGDKSLPSLRYVYFGRGFTGGWRTHSDGSACKEIFHWFKEKGFKLWECRAIMDKKLAACVNILPKSSALYFWKGELEESTEILLLVKTRTSKIGELSNYVRSIHPFEIPEIISLPIDQGNPLYLKWIEENVPRD